MIPIAAPGVVGLAVGRAWVFSLPFATVPAYFLGLLAGWWGAGVGDGWELGFAIWMVLGVLATGVGIGLGALRGRTHGTVAR